MPRSPGRLRAVLLDVGGTLWPERFPPIEDRDSFVVARLRDAFPALSRTLAVRLVKEIDARLPAADTGKLIQAVAGVGLAQDTDALVREAADRCGVSFTTDEATQARRALCIPVLGRIEPFPGARELLRAIRGRGLRAVVVSNTITRDSAVYWNDFEGFGISQYLDVVITSIDVGFRKPHRAIFAAALDAAQCGPQECLMVGNSEENDIIPAKGLGMLAVRVCIEEPPPESTLADAVVTSLHEVEDIFGAWSA